MDLTPKLPKPTINAETLFDIGPIHFTNSMLYALIVMAVLVIFFALATRRMSLVPRGAQNVAEALVEFMLGLCEGTAGKAVGRRILPLIATLFLFIITANWSGLLPGVGTIGGCYRVGEAAGTGASAYVIKTAAPQALPSTQGEQPAASGGLPTPTGHECPAGTEFVPFLRAANADLNMTLAMALIAVITVQVAGIAAHGFGGYLKELFTPVFLAPIHIIGELARIISLSFRLFGNIFGGEVLVTVMYVLLGSVFVGFGTVIFLGLELLFGFIQALLFSILTLVFITTAVAGHGGGHEAAHATTDEHTGEFEALGERVASRLAGSQTPGAGPAGSTSQHMGG
jgi:F-type H+-transporting ATPase subunit a